MANKKHFLWGIAALTLLFGVVAAGCNNDKADDDDTTSGNNTNDQIEYQTVTDFNLTSKIAAPQAGGNPPALLTGANQYTGAIQWVIVPPIGAESPAGETFAARTQYKALITLTAKSDYTLESLTDDAAFTHTGAEEVSYDNTNKQVSLTFPQTGYQTAGLYVNEANTAQTGVNDLAGNNLLEKAFLWIKNNAQQNGSYTIVVVGYITYNEKILTDEDVHNQSGVTITLTGLGRDQTIQLTGTGNLFKVDAPIRFVLDNITLSGVTDNTTSLVRITNAGAELIMQAGAKIIDNRSISDGHGAGVSVGPGKFIMNGGEISRNKAFCNYALGGGVYIKNSGTFIMAGGKISGNSTFGTSWYMGTALFEGTSLGGGVYVDHGTFTMTGGEISGNIVMGSQGRGGGVHVQGNNFTKTGGGIIYGCTDGDTLSNKVTEDNGTTIINSRGHAVRINDWADNRCETTVGIDHDLDATKDGAAGGWDVE